MKGERRDRPPARIVETHISYVLLLGDRAYKLKKPVSMGFLDFSTPEARERACRQEVALNRRLAPDVYQDVWTLSDGSGRPLERLVVMKRMPEDRRLATLVRAGADVAEGLRDVARQLAALHARAVTSDRVASQASRDAVSANWEANFDQMRDFVGEVLDPAAFERVQTLSRAFLAGRKPLFDDRIAAGQAREGHGDLLAEDIFLLDDGPRILDCIEFDERLRYEDVLLDAAFLAMDLERLGAPDLGSRFLHWYDEFWGHGWPASLAHHYVAYRAHVRSKVACLRHAQGDPGAYAEARGLHDLCLTHLEEARLRLVLVGGPPGTGKSTLSAALSAERDWTLLRSDEVRKDLAGLSHETRAGAPFGQGLYTPARVDATYGALLDRARTALERGESVILDASWASGRWREAAADVARATSGELVQLRCDAPLELAVRRIAARSTEGTDTSDATPGIAATLAARFEPWPEAVTIDTVAPVAASLRQALVATRDGGFGASSRQVAQVW